MEAAAEIVREKKSDTTFLLLKISQQDKQDLGNGFYQVKKHEFVWRGIMYDIVSELNVGEYSWYLVYPDRKETVAIAQIRQMNEYKHEKQANDKTKAESMTFFNWFVSDLVFAVNMPAVSILKHFVAQWLFLPNGAVVSIKKPPKM